MPLVLLGLAPRVRAQVATDWMLQRGIVGRAGHAMAWDSARQRLVMFGGGYVPSGLPSAGEWPRFVADTWERTGDLWVERAPATRPEPRYGHAMAYDAARGRVVLFGGMVFRDYKTWDLSDTWEWDGVTWTARAPAVAPPARHFHALAYDATRQRIVLFGGYGFAAGLLSDTWEWDGVAWTRRSTTGPPPRADVSMACDVARRRVVLVLQSPTVAGAVDTWEWDGASWSQRVPAVSPTCWRFAIAYDARRSRTVLVAAASASRLETWEWDGTDWTPRRAATAPGTTSSFAVAYDALRRRVVQFGDGVPGGDAAETWEWDGTSWTLHRAAGQPFAYRDAMAWDSARQRVVLFGGIERRTTQVQYLSDTWTWDGVDWTPRRPARTPTGRHGGTMVDDAARQRVVLFGGQTDLARLSDTWEWDGTDWTERTPMTSPGARAGQAGAYDGGRQRVVLFGGDAGGIRDDTWEWDGTDWIQRRPAIRPHARMNHAMAYDPARRRVVLFGGITGVDVGDTWEWDGTDWTERRPSVSPGARHAHVLVYDASRQRVVLHGGTRFVSEYEEPLRDTWEWDGTNWTERPTVTGPYTLSGRAAAWDAARERVVVFAGTTWLYGALAPARATSHGAGCGGGAAPVLTSTEPWLGNRHLLLDVMSARVLAPVVLGLAADRQDLALGGGCTLYLREPIVPLLAITNAAGFASVSLDVPCDVALRGAPFFAQAFVLDPAGPVLDLAFSNERRLAPGD